MVVNCWFAYNVFLIAVRGFGLGSEMTWTLPTRNPVIPLLRATIIRDIRLALEATEVSVLFGEVTSSPDKRRCRQRVPPPLETLRAVHLEGIQREVHMKTWWFVLCFFLRIGEGSVVRLALCPSRGNPLQFSCLENPMDRGTWQFKVHGVIKESGSTQ